MTEFSELFLQLPVAGLMLVVVWKFLQHIKERDDNWLETIRERDNKFLTELREHDLSMQAIQREVLEAFKNNSATVAQCTVVLEKVDRKLTNEKIVDTTGGK